ncbi:hypothetical protein HB778_37850 (plasmid) [Mesorhizobium huakuii]|uniref:UDP-N-acetylglucosamine 1-carboxyvinyltransferase n=1 Tax=Mesorhizobium huakuii TaxID=28104 RepID=A0A7G6T5B4_9HYPH|nr:hypothetical protein HB778_37850 [Mesorhizobium huakuii]
MQRQSTILRAAPVGYREGGKIEEHVWVNRFDYASGLTALGAEMHSDGPVLHITPGRAARPGQTVRGNDLRAAATLVLAALGIDGETIIQGVEHLGRGYADLAGQLTSLGASIDQRATS